MEYRIEKDTLGEVKVPAEAYYGAQTQRSIDNFRIARDINKMPKEIIAAFAYLKKAAAITNFETGFYGTVILVDEQVRSLVEYGAGANHGLQIEN